MRRLPVRSLQSIILPPLSNFARNKMAKKEVKSGFYLVIFIYGTHFFKLNYIWQALSEKRTDLHYKVRIFKKQKNNNCKANNHFYLFTKKERKESYLMHRLAKTIVQQKIKKKDLIRLLATSLKFLSKNKNFPKICFSILE